MQRLIPFNELLPKDQEPRVSFYDQQVDTVETSALEDVPPETVINSYKRLLTRGNPEVRKEALHRLADLTMRLAEIKLGDENNANLASSVKSANFNDAIQLYSTLLREYPNYPKIDQVKYQLARAHSLNSDPESSLAILDQIAVNHNASVTYLESQFRRGEAYFVRKNYPVAENAYSEVISKGANSEYYDKALYKRGWSLFKQNNFSLALQDFFILYERLVHQQSAGVGQTRLVGDLIKDTLRVISLSFYNQDGAETVNQYFAQFGRKNYEDKIYAALADLYIEQERFKDAADTYLGFINLNPIALSAPDFHTKVIEIYRKGGFPSLILPAKENFVNSYGRNSQFWAEYSGKVIDDLMPLLRLHLDDISKYYHAKAQQSKQPKDYLVAAKWYREILATFNEPQIDSEYRYALAEALFDGKQLLQAAHEFEIVAYKNPISKFSRDAGYKALLALQAYQHPKGATQTERLMPLIQSGTQFTTVFNQDEKTPQILANVAEQQLQIGDVLGAITSSENLLALPTKISVKQKERALIIIANGLFDLKDYAKAEVAITQLLNSVKLNNKQRQIFRQRRAESVYQLADAAKQAGQLEQAIQLFLKVKALEPTLAVAATAYFDAAVLMIQTQQWDLAAQALEGFRLSYPKHPLAKDIPEKLALIYEQQQDWSKAAVEYNLLSKQQNDPELARAGYWKVAELYHKAKLFDKAIAAYKFYVWEYPQPYLLAQEARAILIELYTGKNDSSKRDFWRKKIVEFYAQNKAKNNTRTAYLAAKSQYDLSLPLFESFKRIKLKLPLAKSLKSKRSAMKKALQAYNQIGAYGIAEFTTASTHKVAQIYQILATDLMNSERPKGLNEDELEEYGFLLEDQALPFEDKAISFYETNAQRTKQAVYDDSVKASIDSLRKLKPIQYDKHENLEALSNVSF
ncbi:tetratricopeptide repeat protein [Aliikangiella sp. IMCC44632]